MFKRPKNKDGVAKAKARVMRKKRPDSLDAQEADAPPAHDVPDAPAHVPGGAVASDGAAVKKEEENGAPSNNNDDNDDDEEEEGSTLDRIMQTKKKRRLKNSLMRSQPSGLKKRRIAATKKEEDGEDDVKDDDGDGDNDTTGGAGSGGDLGKRLKGTFGGGADPSSSGAAAGGGAAGEGVLGKKHRAAMEKYIQDRMGGDDDGDGQEKNGSGGGKPEGGTIADLDEDALYRQVAAEVGAAGVAGHAEDIDNPQGAGESAPAPAPTKEDDVGAGGMMLAGTGIAEVALPVDERIRTVRETELLASSRGRTTAPRIGGGTVGGGLASSTLGPVSARDLESMLPTSFGKKKGAKEVELPVPPASAVPTQPLAENSDASTAIPVGIPGGTGGGRIASSAGTAVLPTDVANLSQSYSHNFKMHTHQWVSDRKTEQQREIDRVRKEQEVRDGTAENQSRVGFDQARRVARGEVPAGGESSSSDQFSSRRSGPAGAVGAGGDRNRSSDDRVWRSFVSKSRNRR